MPTPAQPVPWTPARLRAATPRPKPRGAIARARAYEFGALLTHSRHLTRGDAVLLRYMVEHGHLEPVACRGRNPFLTAGVFVVELPVWVVDALAAFEAELAEHEPDEDREDDGCAEPNADDQPQLDQDEEGEDEEPNMAAAERFGGPTDGENANLTVRQWRGW